MRSTVSFATWPLRVSGRMGEVYLAPPAWWNGKGVAISRRPVSSGPDRQETQARYQARGFGAVCSVPSPAWRPCCHVGLLWAAASTQVSSRFLRPANGKTGPGPEVFVSARHVLTLAGEYVDISKTVEQHRQAPLATSTRRAGKPSARTPFEVIAVHPIQRA